MKNQINIKPPLFISNIFIKSIVKNNNGIIKIKKVKNDEKIDNNDNKDTN